MCFRTILNTSRKPSNLISMYAVGFKVILSASTSAIIPFIKAVVLTDPYTDNKYVLIQLSYLYSRSWFNNLVRVRVRVGIPAINGNSVSLYLYMLETYTSSTVLNSSLEARALVSAGLAFPSTWGPADKAVLDSDSWTSLTASKNCLASSVTLNGQVGLSGGVSC